MRRLAHRAASGEWIRNASAGKQTVAACQPASAATGSGQGPASQCTAETRTAFWPDAWLIHRAGSLGRGSHVAAHATEGRNRALLSDVAWPSEQHWQSIGQHCAFRLYSSATAAASAAAPQHAALDSGNDATISLAFPTFMVWGANTDVGKTLFSAGLAAAAVRAKVIFEFHNYRQSRTRRSVSSSCTVR